MKYDWSYKNILIAEDEEYNFMLLEEILSETSANPIWVKNGQEAVDYVLRNKVDLVLMDVKMPILNGIEATKQIRQKNIDVPIIAQTAYALSADRQICISAGCNEYIDKPIDPDRILALISEFI